MSEYFSDDHRKTPPLGRPEFPALKLVSYNHLLINQASLMILIRYEFLTELKYNIALLVSSLIKDSVPTHLVSMHHPFWTGFFHFFEVFVNKTVLYRGFKDISQEIRQVIICISRIGNCPIIIVLAFKTGCRYLLNYIDSNILCSVALYNY